MTRTHQGSVCWLCFAIHNYNYSGRTNRLYYAQAQIVRHSCAGAPSETDMKMMSCGLALYSQSFPFYLLRCYKNPVLRAATLRELNEDCGRLRLGPYKDRARAIIHTRRRLEPKIVRSLGTLFTVGMAGKKRACLYEAVA